MLKAAGFADIIRFGVRFATELYPNFSVLHYLFYSINHYIPIAS